MKNVKSHFSFNKQERSGILYLLLLIIVLQLFYLGLKYYPFKTDKNRFELDIENQSAYDSLVIFSKKENKSAIKMFNPNFISDFKGYSLGMSIDEIDRIKRFRAQDKWINSIEEFQTITKVSDSLLKTISPFFKFPDWVNKKKKRLEGRAKEKLIVLKDLNKASALELQQIRGIGEKLSARIVKFRNRLGGFLVDEQLYDVYGLEPEVIKRVLKQYQVLYPPNIKKININTANIDELTTLVYFKYKMAENIVRYREENGPFESKEDLFNVVGFPINKIDRIALYLLY
ncbi:MAG: ComEA family DNA-binding protein [Croceivirga sp.]